MRAIIHKCRKHGKVNNFPWSDQSSQTTHPECHKKKKKTRTKCKALQRSPASAKVSFDSLIRKKQNKICIHGRVTWKNYCRNSKHLPKTINELQAKNTSVTLQLHSWYKANKTFQEKKPSPHNGSITRCFWWW